MSEAEGRVALPPQAPRPDGRRLHSYLETKYCIQASPQVGNASLPTRLLPSQPLHPLPSAWLPPSHAHPGVVAGVELLRHGGNVLHQELVPLPLKVDLVHVDVNGRHVFVATLDAVVLGVTKRVG